VKIPVKDEIDPSKVEANLKRGILNISFTKTPKKTISIEEEE
jgi:HSP20 family molecular chaperone IbpA